MKSLFLIVAVLLPFAASQEFNVGTCDIAALTGFLAELPNAAVCTANTFQFLDPSTATGDSQLEAAANTFCHPDCGRAFAEFLSRGCADPYFAIGLTLFCLPTGAPDGLNRCRFNSPDVIEDAILNDLSACSSFNSSNPTCDTACSEALMAFSQRVGCCYEALYTDSDVIQGFVDGEVVSEARAALISSINDTLLWSTCSVTRPTECNFDPFPGESTLAVGTCTQDELNNYIDTLDPRCGEATKIAFNPTSPVAEISSALDVICTQECGGAVAEWETDNCNDEYVAGLSEPLCRESEGTLGDRCYITVFQDLTNTFASIAPCFAYDPEVGTCPAGCQAVLTGLTDQLGCCYQSFYNNTEFLDYLILSGQLTYEGRVFFGLLGYDTVWNACQVPLVDECTGGFGNLPADGAIKFIPSSFAVLLAAFLAIKLF